MREGFTEALAEEIRAEMARREMTQSQLAELTGINRMSLSRRLTAGGALAFDTDDLVRIARALNMPLLDLLTRAIREPARAVA